MAEGLNPGAPGSHHIPQEVVHRAVIDSEFRNELLANPSEANTTYNLGISQAGIDFIESLDVAEVEKLLAGVEAGIYM